MSVFSHCYLIILDRGISAPEHVKQVVDGINDIDKINIYIYQLMSNVQLPESKTFYSQILMHSCTSKNGVSMAEQFQKHLYK